MLTRPSFFKLTQNTTIMTENQESWNPYVSYVDIATLDINKRIQAYHTINNFSSNLIREAWHPATSAAEQKILQYQSMIHHDIAKSIKDKYLPNQINN